MSYEDMIMGNAAMGKQKVVGRFGTISIGALLHMYFSASRKRGLVRKDRPEAQGSRPWNFKTRFFEPKQLQ